MNSFIFFFMIHEATPVHGTHDIEVIAMVIDNTRTI